MAVYWGIPYLLQHGVDSLFISITYHRVFYHAAKRELESPAQLSICVGCLLHSTGYFVHEHVRWTAFEALQKTTKYS